MGYRHIDNLYKNQTILAFKECYALEKIHGTSAHVSFSRDGTLGFFSGGCKYESFVQLFNTEALTQSFKEWIGGFSEGGPSKVIVYGEAFGGKMQGMSHMYGKDLDFVAFEVAFKEESGNERFLDVPTAHKIATKLGFKFVWFDKVPADIKFLNELINKPSPMGLLKTKGEHIGEGVVLRPLEEFLDPFGNRIIVKHKHDSFRETAKPRVVEDPNKLAVLQEADAIAKEWVTEMRLAHLLDKHQPDFVDPKNTPVVIKEMQEDITREAKGEIVISDEALKAIGKVTARLFIAHCKRLPSQ
jgi:hypothetical protein